MFSCQTCSIEINPEWTYVLANNRCPKCGEPIMSDSASTLLTELKEAMTQMPNNPEGLAGWLLSNYTLQKIGEAKPVNLYSKQTSAKRVNVNDEPTGNIKINHDNVAYQTAFMDRAGIKKTISADEIIKQIQENGNKDLTTVDLDKIDEESFPEVTEELVVDQPTPDSIAAQLKGKSVKELLANNSLVISEPGAKPLSKEELKALAVFAQDHNTIGEQDLHPILQADRLKRLEESQRIANGMRNPKSTGRTGGFSRSG